MIYSFACPAPCNREIKVEAAGNADAVEKIILAGAIGCRNSDNRCACKQANFSMPPISKEQMRHIIELCMQEGRDASLGRNELSAPA